MIFLTIQLGCPCFTKPLMFKARRSARSEDLTTATGLFIRAFAMTAESARLHFGRML
jgi:hypothetical protein